MSLKVLISRDSLHDTEVALAEGFRAAGHTVFLRAITQRHQIINIVRDESIDLSVHRCYSQNPYGGISLLRGEGHKCRFAYWERGWPRFLPLTDARRKVFDLCFTACNDGTAIMLPQASADHLHLRTGTPTGLTLIGAYKINPNPLWGKTRPELHKRLVEDMGPTGSSGLLQVHSSIQPHNKRFGLMAGSWASIGIWNVDTGVPLRHFEIVSCGTPLFCYPFPELRNHFIPNKHYVETDNMQESVDYYTAHPKELQDIAAAGHEHFMGAHTYKHRAQQIVRAFQERGYL